MVDVEVNRSAELGDGGGGATIAVLPQDKKHYWDSTLLSRCTRCVGVRADFNDIILAEVATEE